jgi:quinol monooxygenase YgiN
MMTKSGLSRTLKTPPLHTIDYCYFVVHKSLFVPIVAKSDTVENVTAFLASAIPLVEAEPKTIQWYGVKFTNFSTPTFAIFDTFCSECGRQTHLNGKVAGALFDNADALLSAAPEIDPGNILASKVVGVIAWKDAEI